MAIFGFSVAEKPRPEADAELASAAEGLNLKDEQDRAFFRVRVHHLTRTWPVSRINALLNERKRSRYDASYQLSREFLIRRRREGAW